MSLQMANDTKPMDQIIDLTRELPSRIKPLLELLLGNLVFIGEIPAPTFHEQKRIKFLVQRFTECGLQNCSIDEKGNGAAILPGETGEKTILVAAHADTPFDSTVNHSFSISSQYVAGPGAGDNSLGLAVLATLPTIMARLNLRLQSNLLLLGTTSSLEKGNQEGIRFFLANKKTEIAAGIALEGILLGRLGFRSMATMGGEIICRFNTLNEKDSGAIDLLNQIIHQLRKRIRQQFNDATLVLGAVDGGASYKTPARSARLRFLVRSENDDTIEQTMEQINQIVAAVQHDSSSKIRFDVIVRNRAGGLEIDDPFIVQTKRIMKALGILPLEINHSTNTSSFMEQGIPALCLGLTTGENLNYPDERVAIAPITTGVAQLIGLLFAIDGGCCGQY